MPTLGSTVLPPRFHQETLATNSNDGSVSADLFPNTRRMLHCEHLPLPSNTDDFLDSVPYCSTTDYDFRGFLDYPIRVGWPHFLPGLNIKSLCDLERSYPSSDSRLEDFLQTWLFFGLLYEVLGPIYNKSRYVTSNCTVVHTRNLEEDLSIWVDAKKEDSSEQRQQLSSYLHECLLVASSALSATHPSVHLHFNRNIRQSLLLLCEAVLTAVESTLPRPNDSFPPMSWMLGYFDRFMVPHMEDNNWCYSEAWSATRNKRFAASLYYMERMMKPDLGRDHRICNQNQCRYLTTDDKTYRTQHSDTFCACRDVSISLESLTAVLDQGTWPVLRLSVKEDSALNVVVEPFDNNNAYVALSHVWADGLGNKKGNSLPTCQLTRLHGLLRGLQGRRREDSAELEGRDLRLWCDTLCVPIESPLNPEQNRARALAMRKLRNVYHKSAYVLVLDRSLEPYNVSKIGLTEAAFRIMTSPWAQRLWTYQEAALPDYLLFQFADEAIDLIDIYAYHDGLKSKNIPLIGMCRDILLWFSDIRRPFWGQPGQALELQAVVSSVRGRHVSYAADEPLCLATIFDLDISRIQGNQEERMGEFWRMLSESPTGIPSSVVLNEFPRMHTPGFRWAPSTLLVASAFDTFWEHVRTGDGVPEGELIDAGLISDVPALEVYKASCIMNAVHIEDHMQLRWGELLLHDLDGTWYQLQLRTLLSDTSMREVEDAMALSETKMMMHFKHPLGSQGSTPDRSRYPGQFGLLTKPTDARPCVYRSLATMQLTPKTDSEQIFWTAAHKIAMELSDSDIQAGKQAQHFQSPTECDATSSEHSQDVIMPILVGLVGDMFEQDSSLVQVIQSMRLHMREQIELQEFLATAALDIVVGKYLTVREKFDDSYGWCID